MKRITGDDINRGHVNLTIRAERHGGWLTSYPQRDPGFDPPGDFPDDPPRGWREPERDELRRAA